MSIQGKGLIIKNSENYSGRVFFLNFLLANFDLEIFLKPL